MKRFLPGSRIDLKTVRLHLGVSSPPKAMVLLLKLFCLHFQATSTSTFMQSHGSDGSVISETGMLFLKRGQSGFVLEDQHLAVKK